MLHLARPLILGGDVHNAVGVDIKSDLDLRDTPGCAWNAIQKEFAERHVVVGHCTLPLKHVNLYLRLIVRRRSKHLALRGRNGRVALNYLGENTAQRLKTERQRGDINKNDILMLTGENSTL